MSSMLLDQRNAPSGNAISIDNIKNSVFIDTLNQINVGTTSTVLPNFQLGSLVLVNITANVTVTVGTPINMPVPFGPGQTSVGLQWQLFIQNSSGVTLTASPILGAIYRVSGAIPAPASWTNGVAVSVNLFWDGSHHTGLGPLTTTPY